MDRLHVADHNRGIHVTGDQGKIFTGDIPPDRSIQESYRQTFPPAAVTLDHAWESEDAPLPLPMPLQALVSEPALGKIDKLAEGGHEGARQLSTYWVGQGVGLMNEIQTTRQVVYDFMEDFLEATDRLRSVMDDD